MLPTAERHALVGGPLPSNPKDGEVYIAAEGQEAGASYVLSLHAKGEPIGHSSQISKVPNVSGRTHLNRTVTTSPVTKGDKLHVKFTRFSFGSVIFIDSFGWIGKDLRGDPVELINEHYKVIATLPVVQNETHTVYDKICLVAIEE